MKKDISQSVLNTIKEKNIIPKAKWEFLLKDYLVFGTGIISLIIGSLATSVLIYMVANNDWDIYERIGSSFMGFALKTLPYFWIVFFAVFILVADYNLRHTKKGYKYSLKKLAIFSVVLSILFGSFFYSIGLGRAIDRSLAGRFPVYHKFFHDRASIWMNPEKGLLIGTVYSIENENNFVLDDFMNNRWIIISDNIEKRGPVEFEIGKQIRLLGEMIEKSKFNAREMRPWMNCGSCAMHDRMEKFEMKFNYLNR